MNGDTHPGHGAAVWVGEERQGPRRRLPGGRGWAVYVDGRWVPEPGTTPQPRRYLDCGHPLRSLLYRSGERVSKCIDCFWEERGDEDDAA